jgi:hypothetical protein
VPVIRDETLVLAPQPLFQVRADIKYRLDFTEDERRMTDAFERVTGGIRLWRDLFHLYGIDSSPRTKLALLNGIPIGFLPWDPTNSIRIERSFTFARRYLDEDVFGDDEIQCEIEVRLNLGPDALRVTARTDVVTLPGGTF